MVASGVHVCDKNTIHTRCGAMYANRKIKPTVNQKERDDDVLDRGANSTGLWQARRGAGCRGPPVQSAAASLSASLEKPRT